MKFANCVVKICSNDVDKGNIVFKWFVESIHVTALSLKKNCLRSLYKLHFKRKCNSSSVSLALQNLHQ